MPELSLWNTWIFFVKHIIAFWYWGRVESTLFLHLGAILNGEITKKKKSTKIWETWHYIYHQKDICLQDKNWNKKVEHHLVFLLFEYQVTQKSHCCIYICDWPWKCHEYWFWCYKYILVSKWIPIMESINNEDQLFSWPLNDVGVGPVDTPCVTFSPL